MACCVLYWLSWCLLYDTGSVMAGEKICIGEIDNAFALIGAGGHNFGKDYFGGYCCFNDVVIAITYLREVHNI